MALLDITKEDATRPPTFATVGLDSDGADAATEFVLPITGRSRRLATAIWPSAFAKVLQIVRQGGTISFVGLSPGDFATPIFDAVLKPITRSGSIVGTLQDLKEAIEFAAYGKVKAHIHRSHLEDIKTVFENLKSGTVDGRVVLEPPRTPVDSSCIGWPAPGQPPYNSN